MIDTFLIERYLDRIATALELIESHLKPTRPCGKPYTVDGLTWLCTQPEGHDDTPHCSRVKGTLAAVDKSPGKITSVNSVAKSGPLC